MVKILWFLSFFYLLPWTHTLDLPLINLDSLGGQLGFIGDYAGISHVKDQSQFESLPNDDTTALLMTDDTLLFKLFGSVNGTISTSCKLSDSIFILAGNFNTINETTYNHIAQFDTQTFQLSPLQQGLDGPVRSLYCDLDQSIYVGGDFIAPVNQNVTDYTGHVAIYKQSQWFPVPWKGFNGPVYSIIRHQQQQSILFAGQFDSTGDGQFFNENTSQTINLLSSATISAGNSANFGNNTNPSSVVCSQSPWLLQDGIPGYWEAQFNSPVEPSVFRLTNAHLDGRNTNEFNIISLGSNQYFQLSYTNPTTGQLVSCTDKCILSNDPTIAYQDFTVTTPVTTNGIRINIDSWFGPSGGLSNVQIFRSDVSLQPQPVNDNPSTVSCSNTPSSTASTTGNWSQVFSYQTYRNFLIAKFPATELQTNNVSVTYQPYISGQGIYNVYATTPGCVGTSTCDQRTQVMLDITLNPGNTTTYALDQQNAADQRTLIYTGPITASSSAFQPTIQMRVSPTAPSPSSGTVSIAADSLEFIRNNTGTLLSSILNYYPLNNTWLPLPQQLPITSTVHTLQSNGNRIYIGGNFKSNTTFANLVTFDFASGGFIPVQNTGLNGAVSTLLLVGSQLIVGGFFNNTEVPSNSPFNHVAIYNLDTNTLSAMNDGVDGPVKYLYSLDNSNVHLSGSFNSVNMSNAYNNAQWDLSKSQWVPSSSFILGPIATQLALSNGQELYLGDIKAAQTYRANTIASLERDQWRTSITNMDPNATVDAGVFWQNGDTNTIILGGSFNLNNVQYLIAMYDGKTWTGILDTVQGEINTLLVIQDYLCIGGKFKGTVGTIPITSFAVYNLRQRRVEEVQGILRDDGTPGQVNIIRSKADGKSIFVAGDFAFAGLLGCNSICVLGSESRQWRQLGENIRGNIKDMSIYQDSITVVGDLQVGQQRTGLAVLENLNANTWQASSSQDIMSTNSLVNDGTGQFIVSGRSDNQFYLGSWNGKEMNKIDTNLGPSTEIVQLMYLPVQSSPSNARYPANSDTLLMAVGHLDLPDFGTASAALYDGSTWYPYVVTSSSNGTSGSIHSTFTITECCTPKSVRRYLSVPAVILISIAISLAILFFLIALAFIYLFLKRRNNVKYEPAPMQEWKPKHRPSSLLAMLDAAQLSDSAFLSTSAAEAAGAAAAATGSSSKQKYDNQAYSSAVDGRRGPSVDISDTARLRNSSGISGALTSVPFSALMANALKNNNNEAMASDASPKMYYAKFPFEAREFGELAFNAQTPIVVTDTSDDVWWMGYKDDGSGNPISGLFPSNYVSKTKPF